jgi:phosphoribosylformylglycinamidine synthase
MNEVISAAKKGMPILGICNGFQILTESGLLPGVLMRNRSLHFICDTVGIRLENTGTPFTRKGKKDHVYHVPIAHAEGNYFTDADGLKSLEDNQQIVFRYTHNPNGSLADIAGVCNRQRNVLGLMPHPERVCEDVLGGTDGRFVFESLR